MLLMSRAVNKLLKKVMNLEIPFQNPLACLHMYTWNTKDVQRLKIIMRQTECPDKLKSIVLSQQDESTGASPLFLPWQQYK